MVPVQLPSCGIHWPDFSELSTWYNSQIVPPTQHVYQNKFADQTLASFPIGPRTLIGS